jgi:hypothetical protein
MSVSLTISRPGYETEFVSMCGQRTAEEWVGAMARKHGFKILTGDYPTFLIEKGDLDQAIYEVSILREEMFRDLEADTSLSERDKMFSRERWDQLVERLKQLKSEEGWKAHFG